MGKKSNAKKARREHGDPNVQRPVFSNDIMAPSRRSQMRPISRPITEARPEARPAPQAAPTPVRPVQTAPQPPPRAEEPKPQPQPKPQTPGLWAALRATGLKGLIIGVAALLLIIYVVWGLIVWNSGPGTGNPVKVASLFAWLPAASVIVPGKGGAYLLWKLGVVLTLLSLAFMAWLFLGGDWKRRRKMLLAASVITLLLASWALPQTGKWFVSYNDYAHRYDSLKRFQAKQAQITGQGQQGSAQSENQLRAQALQQEIQFRYSVQEAAKYKVTVTDKDVAGLYQQNITSAGGEATLKKQLADYLGWTPADLKRDLRQKLLQDRLNQALAKAYKGEADAANQELKNTKVHNYVHGLKWDNKLRNVQPTT